MLIATRIPKRSMYGGKYEGCGGQLAENETFEEGVVRHFRKEMGIQVRVLTDLHRFYEIRLPNEPVIPGIRFLCEQVDDNLPTSVRHTEVRWVPESEFKRIPRDRVRPVKCIWVATSPPTVPATGPKTQPGRSRRARHPLR